MIVIDEEKLRKNNQRRRKREGLLLKKGICYRCGQRPYRENARGKWKLCDHCHEKQVSRMRERTKLLKERSEVRRAEVSKDHRMNTPQLLTIEGHSVWCRSNASTLDEGIFREVAVLDTYRLRRLLQLGEVETCVDIGAHIGSFGVYLRHLVPDVSLTSYEPFPDNYEVAKLNLGDAVKNCAVTETAKWIVNVQEGNTGANTVVEEFVQGAVPITAVKAVDAVPRGTDLLKIDCEGEEKVIIPALDAAGVLDTIKFIVGEWHFRKKNGLNAFLDIFRKTHNVLLVHGLHCGTFVAAHKSLGVTALPQLPSSSSQSNDADAADAAGVKVDELA